MLTRSRRRRLDEEEQAAIPALANLSDDLLLDCCKLLPVTSLVSFSACSKHLRQVASHGSLWSQLSIPPSGAAGLTDHRLADLLQRIDAKNCMTSISLRGCSQINGNGLWPLQDSTVLRTIDLRRAELNHGLLLHARPLAVSAQQFLVQMLPRLDSVGGSVLVTQHDALASRLLCGSCPIQASPCIMCRELVPASAKAATRQLAKCGSCQHDFCPPCEDAFFRVCSRCKVPTCRFCLQLDAYQYDDDRAFYTCDDCYHEIYENESG